MTDGDRRHYVETNRAVVLTLWAAVVAEHLGFDRDEALTLGRAVAGLNAYSKGKALGLFAPTPADVKKKRRELRAKAGDLEVDLLGRAVPARSTEEGLRALSKEKPMDPASVVRYLEQKLGDALEDVREAMADLAAAYDREELARVAFDLYATFRPSIPPGKAGWGKKGRLSLDRIRAMAQDA